MPKLHLSKAKIDAIEPGPKDVIYHDTELTGYALKVTPTGRKVFLIIYRMGGRNTPVQRYVIGKYGDPCTPRGAREQAKVLLGHVANGIDPHELKQERKRAAASPIRTFEEVATRWYNEHLLPNARRPEGLWRALKMYALPQYGEREFASITREEKYQIIAETRRLYTGSAAQRVHVAMTALENWALDRSIIATANGQRMKINIPYTKRDRVLEDSELKAIWDAAEKIWESDHPTAMLFVRTLMLSGQRLCEVGDMRRSEIKNGNLWTIPAARYKTKKDQEVILVPEILELINASPSTNDLVFPAKTKPSVPVASYSKYKKALSKAVGFDDWCFHDFRRTCASWLQDQGVPGHFIDAMQGHVSKDEQGAFRHYGHAKRRKIKMDTLQLWVNHVLGLNTGLDVVYDGMDQNVVELIKLAR